MAITTAPPRIIPKLTPITPMELYLQQVKSVFDNIRYQTRGFEYVPAQMGGIFGQRQVLEETLVLELTDFEVPGG